MNPVPAICWSANEPGAGKGTNPDLSQDFLLQVARRLDWRFLLPNPDADYVAYLGPENSTLLEALLLFTPSLTQVSRSPLTREVSDEFDLVVVKDPSMQSLEQAARLVGSGGCLYVEAQGWSRLSRPQSIVRRVQSLFGQKKPLARLWFPSRCKEAIRRFGFSSIHVFWHWPNFEACTRIIPVDDTDARTMAFSFQGNGVQWLLKKALAGRLFPPGWVGLGISHFSIIAGKDPL